MIITIADESKEYKAQNDSEVIVKLKKVVHLKNKEIKVFDLLSNGERSGVANARVFDPRALEETATTTQGMNMFSKG